MVLLPMPDNCESLYFFFSQVALVLLNQGCQGPAEPDDKPFHLNKHVFGWVFSQQVRDDTHAG